MERRQKKQTDDQSGFEKARYEYCATLYEKEVKRSMGLETRVQFYFSFTTLVLGAIFLKFDFFDKVKEIIAQNAAPIYAIYTLLFSLVILGLSLIISVIAILAFIRLRTYTPTYPDNIVSALFAPNSQYLSTKTEKDFYSAIALSCALALETNAKITDRQARWVQICSFCSFFTVLSLFLILGIAAYLLLLS